MQCSIGELVEPGLYIAATITCAVLFVLVRRDVARSKKRSARLNAELKKLRELADAGTRSNKIAERELASYRDAAERFMVFQCALWLEAHSATVTEVDRSVEGHRVNVVVERY